MIIMEYLAQKVGEKSPVCCVPPEILVPISQANNVVPKVASVMQHTPPWRRDVFQYAHQFTRHRTALLFQGKKI